ncbi:MAG: hypothetical protein ACK41T_00385 [Pseudobdellovibrio sp.]
MKSKLNSKGQVLIEYILMMVFVVTIAAVLTKSLVGRTSDVANQGMIIKSWNRMIKAIGNDLPDCPNQKDYNSPNCPPP